MNGLRRTFRYFRPDSARLGFVLLLMLAGIGLALLKPWPLAFIVDSVLLEQKPLPSWLAAVVQDWPSATLVAALSVAILVLHFGQGAVTAWQNYLAVSIGLRGLRRVRNQLFDWLLRLSLHFHHGKKTGDLIYRATWDTYAFQTLFQQGLITFATALLSLTLVVLVMARINGLLTLIVMAIVPLLMLAIRVFGRRMSERTLEAQQADSQATSIVQQSIVALPLIQSYTREDQENRLFRSQSRRAQECRQAQHGAELVYWFAVAAVFGAGVAAITWAGADQVMAGKLSVGELLVFLAYLSQVFEPLNQLSHVGATVSSATAGTRRVFEILDTLEDVKETPQARPVRRGADGQSHEAAAVAVHGAIEFNDVCFSYDSNREILRGINFVLAPGESVAILGASGAGKSTLLALLARFFDPTSGAIKLDGVDLRDLKLRDLRAQAAMVFQEPIILPGTVAENIAFARPDATLDEIEAASRAANAESFIRNLAHGFETVIGDGAVHLSVGEKQRINLARAVLKNAPILLLDEPTSALDSASERLIWQSIRTVMKERTTLITTHQLSALPGVSKVLVIENGAVSHFGAPEELRELGDGR